MHAAYLLALAAALQATSTTASPAWAKPNFAKLRSQAPRSLVRRDASQECATFFNEYDQCAQSTGSGSFSQLFSCYCTSSIIDDGLDCFDDTTIATAENTSGMLLASCGAFFYGDLNTAVACYQSQDVTSSACGTALDEVETMDSTTTGGAAVSFTSSRSATATQQQQTTTATPIAAVSTTRASVSTTSSPATVTTHSSGAMALSVGGGLSGSSALLALTAAAAGVAFIL